ncbi:hypothetical protein [Pseudofrankia sp. BMG5.36]|uniref:hypothetical protein n=1 Tax=Pseudofrankia sp. BMG5.36 TaxID=1834512 RepID=UPI001041E86E|nr:hypothetical protein [Pseudofrankia sp. BMG5.36]
MTSTPRYHVALRPLVRFERYRTHLDELEKANNAIMALLVGAQLSVNTLKMTLGSTARIPQIFPNVEHITRINLTPGQATSILASAETHLAMMAIPYVVALHEDLTQSALQLVHAAGLGSKKQTVGLKLAEMHNFFADQTSAFNPSTLALFSLIRRVRNCIIHDAGICDAAVRTYWEGLKDDDKKMWSSYVGSVAVFDPGKRIPLGHREIIITLFVVRRLAEDINVALQELLPPLAWADILIDDFISEHGKLPSNRDEWTRKIYGYGRHMGYTVSKEQVTEAIKRSKWAP